MHERKKNKMNFLTNIHSKQFGFVMIAGAILLFASFIQTIMLASFVAIMEPDKMPLSAYLLTLGQSFMYRYYFHIPAIGFLVFGLYGLKRK